MEPALFELSYLKKSPTYFHVFGPMFWPHTASYQFAHYTAYGTFITVLLRIFLINCSKAFILLSVFQVNQFQDVIIFLISRKKKRK